jgi:AcrR family transcriptional regulator
MSTVEIGGRARRRSRTREAILHEALAMMAEGGVGALAWRELARRLDYSPAGLYRYFANSEEIISTLAGESMALLADHLRNTPATRANDPLVAIGLGYLAFAREQPVRFRLLLTELRSTRRSLNELADGASAYAVLVDAVRTAITEKRISSDVDAEWVAYTLWALAHGMAVLESTHLRGFDAQFEQVHELALRQLVRGWRASPSAGTEAP